MKIKLDENLPSRLVAALGQLGHDADTVAQERLTGRPDADIGGLRNVPADFLSRKTWTFLIFAASSQARITGCFWCGCGNRDGPRSCSECVPSSRQRTWKAGTVALPSSRNTSFASADQPVVAFRRPGPRYQVRRRAAA